MEIEHNKNNPGVETWSRRNVGDPRPTCRNGPPSFGDRVTFLAMMDKDVVADIKQVALDEHRAACDVMEQAALEF